MNNLLVFVIIILFLIICVSQCYNIKKINLEHLTQESDNIIQNISDLYNKDELKIDKVQLGDKWAMSGVGDPVANDNVFRIYKADNSGLANIGVKELNTDKVKTKNLQLGDKWLFSSGKDGFGSDDDWLRVTKADGSAAYYGGIAAGRLYDARIGDLKTVNDNLQGGINSINSRLGLMSGVAGGYRCADYGIAGGDNFGMPSTDLNACANECRNKFGNIAMCAQTRANDNNDKRCFCRSALGYIPDGNWNAKLLV